MHASLLLIALAVNPRQAGFVDLELNPRSNPRIETLAETERFAEAFLVAVDELRDRCSSKGPMSPEALLSLHRVGTIAHLAGDQGTADDVLGAVLEARRRVLPEGDPAIVETLLRRGRAARYRGQRAIARACYDEAEAILARHPASEAVMRCELAQRNADWLRGRDFLASIPLYEDALLRRRAIFAEPSFAIADNLAWSAWTLAHAGRHREAAALGESAARQLDALGLRDHTLRATVDSLRGDLAMLAGREAEAEPLYRAAAEGFAEVRRRQWGGFSRREVPLDGFEALAVAAIHRGDGEEAWRLLERGRAATHVDFTTLGTWPRRDPAGFASWSGLRRRLEHARKHLRALSGGAPLWNEETWAAFLETLTLRGRIEDAERRFLDANRPALPDVARVRRSLGAREALVGWVEWRIGGTPDGSIHPDRSLAYAFVLKARGPIAWVPLWDNRSAEADARMETGYGLVFEMLRRAASWPSRVEADPAIVTGMRAWGRLNVDPILPHLAGVDHVILERLTDPVELAVLPDGRSFGDAFDVSRVPSALAFVLLAETGRRDAHAGPPSILAVAGPTEHPPETRIDQLVLAADATSAHRLLRSAYRRSETPLDRLPPLRYAELEARSIAAMFPRSTVLTEADEPAASIARLAARDALRPFRVIHVAAHTLTDGAPERSALALSDRRDAPAGEDEGIVEVEDITLGWALDADLMTLSGCETLRSAGARRGEPYGFTPALFASGARRILSSCWPVDDRATAILMNRFYENYTGRSGPAMTASRALREAKAYVRTLRDPAGKRPYEHPVYWAGFFLLGLPD